MRKKLLRIAAVAALLALPFIVRGLYVWITALPRAVTIAAGPEKGRYIEVCRALADELSRRHPRVTVQVLTTGGSLENMRLLQAGKVDFALYQPNTASILHAAASAGQHEISFVANLYSEVAHFIVRHDSEIKRPGDLKPHHRVAVGQADSGDYAMSRILLSHFGLTEQDVTVRRLSYLEIEQEFDDGSLDAAFITAGVRAEVFRDLFADGHCRLIDIPHAEALSLRRLSLSPYTIPAGLYRSPPPTVPERGVETVALRAQLLTRSDANTALVEEATAIVLNERFIKQTGLVELFAGGAAFARRQPEFAPHPATADVYDPHLRPLLDSEFVEATEGLRSFTVSCLIAAWLAWRWYRRRRIRSSEHRLDQYIHQILAIERRQLELDQHEGSADLGQLQTLLDELTQLRQEALARLTAHELNEDRAADSFLEMAHALSDKINAKISRQRLDKRFEELAVLLRNDRPADS